MKQSSEKKERKKHQQHQQKNCRPDGNCNNIIVPSIYLYILHISTTAAEEKNSNDRSFHISTSLNDGLAFFSPYRRK